MSDQARSTKIGLASDNDGHSLKLRVVECLAEERLSFSVLDFGTFPTEDGDCEESMDLFVKAVSSGEIGRGLFVGATAHGLAMFANKFSRVRAVVVQSTFEAELARRHFDANLLCLGQFTPHVERILHVWLKTPFEDQSGNGLSHHARRVAKITALEAALQNSEMDLTFFQTEKLEEPIWAVVVS